MLNKSEPVSYACAVKLLGNWCSRTAVFVFSRTFQPLCKKRKEAKTKTKNKKKNKRKSTKDWCSSGLLSYSCWLRFFFFLLAHFKKMNQWRNALILRGKALP